MKRIKPYDLNSNSNEENKTDTQLKVTLIHNYEDREDYFPMDFVNRLMDYGDGRCLFSNPLWENLIDDIYDSSRLGLRVDAHENGLTSVKFGVEGPNHLTIKLLGSGFFSLQGSYKDLKNIKYPFYILDKSDQIEITTLKKLTFGKIEERTFRNNVRSYIYILRCLRNEDVVKKIWSFVIKDDETKKFYNREGVPIIRYEELYFTSQVCLNIVSRDYHTNQLIVGPGFVIARGKHSFDILTKLHKEAVIKELQDTGRFTTNGRTYTTEELNGNVYYLDGQKNGMIVY